MSLYLLPLLLGCTSRDAGVVSDTWSYPGLPQLVDAAVRCEGDQIVFSARTRGWHESAVADIWAKPSDPAAAHTSVIPTSDPPNGGFLRNETCDKMWGISEPDDEVNCQLALSERTILIRVNHEEGCAGCMLIGPGVADVEAMPDNDSRLALLPGQQCPHTALECNAFLPAPTPELRLNSEVEGCAPQR